jgi:phosphoheptose isomerase
MMPDPIANARAKCESAAREFVALTVDLSTISAALSEIASTCANALRNGHKLLFCGNGGSAAECQHLATEFVVRLSSQRDRRALSAMALTTDTSLLTACANDFGFDQVFARQVEAHLQSGDVLILLSTSGRSPNLLKAAEASKARGGVNVAFLGADPTPLNPLVKHALHLPARSPQRVQEGHLMFGHLLVELVEDSLFDTDQGSSR